MDTNIELYPKKRNLTDRFRDWRKKIHENTKKNCIKDAEYMLLEHAEVEDVIQIAYKMACEKIGEQEYLIGIGRGNEARLAELKKIQKTLKGLLANGTELTEYGLSLKGE